MVSPFGEFKSQVEKYLSEIGLGDQVERLEVPSDLRLGHLALPLFHLHGKPINLVEPSGLIASVNVNNNYLNFKCNIKKLSEATFNQIKEMGENYCNNRVQGMQVIIEHTSANPLHPMHIGHARNAFLGDSLARLMKARGHFVKTHFYVDDMGLQVMIATIGFKNSPKKPEGVKPDHWIGFVYAVANIMYEIAGINSKLNENGSDYSSLVKKRDELIGYAASLREKFPKEFDELSSSLSKMSLNEWERAISTMIRGMEVKDQSTLKLVRDLVNTALLGFKETLDRVNVNFDEWDWESQQATEEDIRGLVESVQDSPFKMLYKGVLAVDCNAVAKLPEASKDLTLIEKAGKEIPPMLLLRSDNTTLYQTRDVIYSIKKLASADEVYNVVGAEQSLAQLQVKLALYAINHPKASRLHHVPYEMVRLPGRKMAGRYGSYVTLDEVIDLAVLMASNEIRRRNPQMDEQALIKSSEAIGIGAIKYALLSVSAQKVVEFQVERALNFEENSAPFIQYAAVRANNILSTASKRGIMIPEEPDFSNLTDEAEQEIILLCSRLPDTVAYAADTLHVEALASNVMEIADKFNSYYARVPVLTADNYSVIGARLALSKIVYMSLRSALSLLGIAIPEKMRTYLQPRIKLACCSAKAIQTTIAG